MVDGLTNGRVTESKKFLVLSLGAECSRHPILVNLVLALTQERRSVSEPILSSSDHAYYLPKFTWMSRGELTSLL